MKRSRVAHVQCHPNYPWDTAPLRHEFLSRHFTRGQHRVMPHQATTVQGVESGNKVSHRMDATRGGSVLRTCEQLQRCHRLQQTFLQLAHNCFTMDVIIGNAVASGKAWVKYSWEAIRNLSVFDGLPWDHLNECVFRCKNHEQFKNKAAAEELQVITKSTRWTESCQLVRV